jgi:hypothetical protein
MRTARSRIVPLIMIGIAAMGLTLAGCADTSAERIQESVEKTTGQELGVDFDSDGAAEVPEEWPASVPLPPGRVFQSTVFNSLISISTEGSDIDAALAHVDTLVAAGFTVVDQSYTEDDGDVWNLTNGEYDVNYSVLDAGYGDGSVTIGMGTRAVE